MLEPFKVDIKGWLWYGKEMTLFVLLLPPASNIELVLLDWGERFGFEEQVDTFIVRLVVFQVVASISVHEIPSSHVWSLPMANHLTT